MSSCAPPTRMLPVTTWASAAAGRRSRLAPQASRLRRSAQEAARRRRAKCWRPIPKISCLAERPGQRSSALQGSGATIAAVAQRAQARDRADLGKRRVHGRRRSARCRAARRVISSTPRISRSSPFTNAKSRSIRKPATSRCSSYSVVQDVGRALNPRAIFGQIQGGVMQGLGYALHEEITIGANGRILSEWLRDLPGAARAGRRAG